MLWKPGHSVHANGGHFCFHHSHSTTCLYVCEYVELAQKEESLSTGKGLLVLEGEIITAFNTEKKHTQKALVSTIVSNRKGKENIYNRKHNQTRFKLL